MFEYPNARWFESREIATLEDGSTVYQIFGPGGYAVEVNYGGGAYIDFGYYSEDENEFHCSDVNIGVWDYGTDKADIENTLEDVERTVLYVAGFVNKDGSEVENCEECGAILPQEVEGLCEDCLDAESDED